MTSAWSLEFAVCEEARVREVAARFRPTHVVSITDPGRAADIDGLRLAM